MKPDIADAGRCRKGRLKLEIKVSDDLLCLNFLSVLTGTVSVAWVLPTKIINGQVV